MAIWENWSKNQYLLLDENKKTEKTTDQMSKWTQGIARGYSLEMRLIIMWYDCHDYVEDIPWKVQNVQTMCYSIN